jgi:predicted metal-dependent phosphoesterase TrpH
MLAELHSHTYYSRGTKVLYEGLNSPEQMVKHTKRLGLDAIAITDHDTMKGCSSVRRLSKKYGILVMPGEEVSTADGHLVALGVNEFIPPKLGIDETLELVHGQGGIGIAAHPFAFSRRCLGSLAKKCDAMEVFNALSLERIANIKNSYFAKKYNIPKVAGSDAHCLSMIGYGITDIRASGLDSALKAIRNGRTEVIGRYPPTHVVMDWSVSRLKLSYAYVIDYMNRNYKWPKRTIGRKLLGLVEKSPGNIDYLFRMVAYMSLGSTVIYSVIRQLVGVK